MAKSGIIPVSNDLGFYSQRMVLGDTVYIVSFRYNARLDKWIFDLADANSNPIIWGRPILSSWPLLGILKGKIQGLPKGIITALDMTNQGRDPQELTFGEDVLLFYSEA